MNDPYHRPALAAAIAAFQRRWPLVESASNEEPVFVLASGWRSGSTFLQRLLMPRCFVWGEPFGHSGLLESLSDPLRAFSDQWPEPHFFYSDESPQVLAGKFIANLYPSPQQFLDAQLRYFEELFIGPARRTGVERWGVKTVRLSADHAAYLKWLFPRAKPLFLYRNPYDAFRSFASRRDAGWKWYRRWPDQPVTASGFGRLWRDLVEGFFAERERLGALLVRYEDLAAHNFDEIETYLGFALSRDAADVNPDDGGPPPLDSIAEHERIELAREVGPWAERLGYADERRRERSQRNCEEPPDALDPKKCVVLVPVGAHVEPECDDALRQLEARGYAVRRVRGYAAIDQGRNQMATDALADGFEELLWIDADVAFHPDDVEKLRARRLPIVCGIYPKKGMRAISCHVMPGASGLVFGEGGGLLEVLYAATGFLLVQRQVLLDIQQRLSLPLCNEKFGRPMLPFFLPMVHSEPAGHWYLAEDYAFSQRARECGYQIWADTTIRLKHIGTYGFSWEDAGLELQRFATFHLNLADADPKQRHSASWGDEPVRQRPPAIDDSQALCELARLHPWPNERPSVPRNPHGWLHPSTREMLASVLNDQTRLVLELGAWLGQSTRFIADLAPRAAVVTADHWRGSPPHHDKPELRRLLPALYETFLTNCWAYRNQIIPLRMTVSEALEQIGRLGLAPEVIYVDADHSYEAVKDDLSRVRSLFPNAVVVGDDWDWEGVRRAAVDVAREQGGVIGVHGVAWRFFDRPQGGPGAPPSLLQQVIVSP